MEPSTYLTSASAPLGQGDSHDAESLAGGGLPPLIATQNGINRPASQDMRSWPAKMGQDFFVLAARVLEGVGKDGETVEDPFLVDAQGQFQLTP
jgi:hypothetical protein